MSKVYISSTYTDLAEYRQVVYDTLRRMRYDVIAMEDYVAADKRPLDKCLADVAGCDVYVGIFAWRYGYAPPGHTRCITELEYLQATKLNKERLIFLVDEKASWPSNLRETGSNRIRIVALRKRLLRNHVVQFFTTPQTLAIQVATSLSQWAEQRLLDKIKALRERQVKENIIDHGDSSARRVVNLRPLDSAHTFKDRIREILALGDHLRDANVRLIAVVGRGGMGKTAFVSYALAALERDHLPGHAEALQVNGIIYLSSRSTGLGLERIYTDVGRMLGEPRASALAARWLDGDASLNTKIDYVLECLQEGFYVILLDNLEDYLADAVIQDEGLQLFIEHVLTKPSALRLIITSREQFQAASLSRLRTIHLQDGLPEKDAAALLRELDPDGTLGLRDAPDTDLLRVARITGGIPRVLEILAGILIQDPAASLPQLLNDESALGKELVQRFVAEGYRRLEQDEQQIMQALAVLNTPAPEAAISYLLYPWFPGINVHQSLRRLVTSYFAQVNRITGDYVVHPLDVEYAYLQIPDEPNDAEGYNLRNLELRAADFYFKLQKPRDQLVSLADLSPHLSEFEHRMRAGDYDNAYKLTEPISFECLFKWGYYSKLEDLWERLVGKLTEPVLQAAHLTHLGIVYRVFGKMKEALTVTQKSLEIARRIGNNDWQTASLNNLSIIYLDLGQSEKARDMIEEAVEHAGVSEHKYHGVSALITFGRVYYTLGEYERAISLFRQAIDLAKETNDPGIVFALLYQGRILLMQGRADRAEEILFRAVETSNIHTGYRAVLALGIAQLCQHKAVAATTLMNAIDLCRVIVERAPSTYHAHYCLGTALIAHAVLDSQWSVSTQREKILALATYEYEQAAKLSALPGVLRPVIQDLRIIQSANFSDLETVLSYFAKYDPSNPT